MASPLEAVPPQFEVWKNIKLGTVFKSGEDFCSTLEQDNYKVSEWARTILRQKMFTVATKETDIDLICLSIVELGFPEGASYHDICARAKDVGLSLCPAEVGPQLRLQYVDQPQEESLLIAMEAILDSVGDFSLFCVWRHRRARWLDGHSGSPGLCWRGDGRFVFCLRK